MRKKKDIPVIEGFEITGVAAEGKSLGRWNDLVVFVPFGAPGDVIDLKIDRKKHSYAEGHIERLVKPSELRVEPMCEHFGLCGGCKWQHLPYEYQLQYKQQQVVDAMERIAKVPIPEINPILGSATTTHYRNKLEFTFSNKCWLTREQLDSGAEFPDRNAAGFHIPGAFDKVLDIKRCWLQDDSSNELRLFIRNLCVERGYSFYDIRGQQGFIRMTMTRTASTGEVMEVIVFGEDNQAAIEDVMSAVRDRFPQITSLLYVINLKVNDSLADQEFITYSGRDYIEEEMEGLKFRVGPKSFYQTNSRQAYELYKVARRMAALTGPVHRHWHHRQLRSPQGASGHRHRVCARGHRGREIELPCQRHREHPVLCRRHEGCAHRRLHRRARPPRGDDHRPASRRHARGRGERHPQCRARQAGVCEL